MILNRLAQGIRRQDWFTVVLELVIVVVGILLALQVDNWNEQRKARVEAREWRVQILEDLQKNLRDLRGRSEYYRQALAFGEFALSRLEFPDPPNPNDNWDIVLAAYQAGQIWPYQLTGPTFRQVQNAGGLGLLGDSSVINALAYFYDVTAYDYELISGGLPKYRDMIREKMPWPVQNHIWDSDCQETYFMEGVGESNEAFRLKRCAPPPQESALNDIVETMRQDEALKGALRGRMSQLKVSVAGIGRQIERAQAVIDRLGTLGVTEQGISP